MNQWTGPGRYHAEGELKALFNYEDLTEEGDLWHVRKLAIKWIESDDDGDRKAFIEARDAFFDKNQGLKDVAEKDRLAREKQELDDYSEVSANQAKYAKFIKRSKECGTNTKSITFSECVKTDAGYLYNFYAEWTEYLIFKKSGSFKLRIDKNGEALVVEKNIQQC